MPLDVWIYGPGFGESILLIWDEINPYTNDPMRQGAIIDCFSGKYQVDHPGLVCWDRQDQPDMVLAAFTHPHLDHINGAATVLRKLEQHKRLKRVLWWGGHALRRTRNVYLHAAKHARGEGQEAARMASDLLDELVGFQDGRANGIDSPEVDEGYEFSLAYCGHLVNGNVKIFAISPWEKAQTEYTQWVDKKVRGEPRKGVANTTSMGFLVQYGKAQVLLGGDMERQNWKWCWKTMKDKIIDGCGLPNLDPCLIKVSHHGSKTGEIQGMWEREGGFFGSLRRGGEPPICVITPWRYAGRRLPDPEVVQHISEAGCHLYQTGTSITARGVDANNILLRSFVHFRLDETTNKATIQDHCYCQYSPPA